MAIIIGRESGAAVRLDRTNYCLKALRRATPVVLITAPTLAGIMPAPPALSQEDPMRTLNKEMLCVVLGVQRFKDFIIADNSIRADAGQSPRDWFAETEAYFNAIPDVVMKNARLHKNRNDLDEALRFPVTDEMLRTEYSALGKFPFPADPRGEYQG